MIRIVVLMLAFTSSICWADYQAVDTLGSDGAPKTSHPEWMSQLPDSMRVSELSIPGTHDAGAIGAQLTNEPGFPNAWSNCQDATLWQQLVAGVRFLDLRVIRVDQYYVHHASWIYQSLESALDEIELFLEQFPREVVLCRISTTVGAPTETWPEHYVNNILPRPSIWQRPGKTRADGITPTEYADEAIGDSFLDGFFDNSSYYWPTLGETRGKMVMFIAPNPKLAHPARVNNGRLFASSGNGYRRSGNPNYFKSTLDVFSYPEKNQADDLDHLRQASNDSRTDRLYVTGLNMAYSPEALTTPSGWAVTQNRWLMSKLNDSMSRPAKKTGIVLLDFPGPGPLDSIIALNFRHATRSYGIYDDFVAYAAKLPYQATPGIGAGDGLTGTPLGRARGWRRLLKERIPTTQFNTYWFTAVGAINFFAHSLSSNEKSRLSTVTGNSNTGGIIFQSHNIPTNLTNAEVTTLLASVVGNTATAIRDSFEARWSDHEWTVFMYSTSGVPLDGLDFDEHVVRGEWFFWDGTTFTKVVVAGSRKPATVDHSVAEQSRSVVGHWEFPQSTWQDAVKGENLEVDSAQVSSQTGFISLESDVSGIQARSGPPFRGVGGIESLRRDQGPGAVRMHKWSLILDLKLETLRPWSLAQIDTPSFNTTGPAIGINEFGAIGIDGIYHGNLIPGQWHRVVITVDTTGSERMSFSIDGREVGWNAVRNFTVTGDPVNGFVYSDIERWSMRQKLLLFGVGQSGIAQGEINVGGIQIRNYQMSEAEIGWLGGVTAPADTISGVMNDSDVDGLPDSWEIAHFGSLAKLAHGDDDGDSRSNLEEVAEGTSPMDRSSRKEEGLLAWYPFEGNVRNQVDSDDDLDGDVPDYLSTMDRFGNDDAALGFAEYSNDFTNTDFELGLVPESTRTWSFWARSTKPGWDYGNDTVGIYTGGPLNIKIFEGYLKFSVSTDSGDDDWQDSERINTDWHHYAVVKDFNNEVRFYVDGKLKHTSADLSALTESQQFIHQKFVWKNEGVVDDLSLLSRPLSEHEISVLVNAPFKQSFLTVSYDANGADQGVPPVDQMVIKGYDLAFAGGEGLSRVGHNFTGWNTAADGTGYSLNAGAVTTVAVNFSPRFHLAKLYAQWSPNSYTLSFDSAGGSPVESITQDYDTAVAAPAPPTREGYTFTGWNPAVPQTMPAESRSLAALWSVNSYTLSFDSAGGSPVESITQDYDTAVAAPAPPTREGYTFTGWNPAVPQTMPAESRSLAALWSVNSYTLSFDSAGGSPVESITQDYDTAVAAPAPPTREGYTFTGWNPAVPQTMPAESRSLAALWSVNSYTLSFDSAGGSPVESITQDYDTAVAAPAPPTREGYTFTGWNPAVPQTMPAESRSLAALWSVNSYTLSFDSAGGSPVESITQDYDTAVAAPDAPLRAHYRFVDWTPPMAVNMPPADQVFTAQWLPVFNLSLQEGWNLVSLPILVNQSSVQENAELDIFDWSATGLTRAETVYPGTGYLVFSRTKQVLTLEGQVVAGPAELPADGWNLVGIVTPPPYASVAVEGAFLPARKVDAPIWYLRGNAWRRAKELQPGVGYWVFRD